MFDAFLLQQGATSMLDARDAMIAADQMRFGGANTEAMWAAFARRGMGAGASTARRRRRRADAELRDPDGVELDDHLRHDRQRRRSTSVTTRRG